jgi:hypothetical protein
MVNPSKLYAAPDVSVYLVLAKIWKRWDRAAIRFYRFERKKGAGVA